MKKLVLLFLIINCQLSIVNCSAQWTQTSGPGGGLADGIIVDNLGNFLIGSRGGFFYSQDGGQTWAERDSGVAVNSPMRYLDTVGAYIFAAAENNPYLYRSNDNGAHWTDLTPNLYAGQWGNPWIGAVSHFHNRILVSFNSGIEYSDDFGATWDTLSTRVLGTDSINDPYIAGTYTVGNTLFAAANGGFFKSLDSGETWVHSDAGLEQATANWQIPTSLANTGTALFVSFSNNNGLYRSSDNGATWTQVTNIPGFNNINDVHAHNGAIYVLLEPSILKSTDDGANWTVFSGTVTGRYNRMAFSNGVILTATFLDLGLQRSTDNGASWTEANQGFADTRIQAILADGSNLFAASYEKNLFLSSDAGLTYTSINTVSPITPLVQANDIIKVGNEIVIGGYNRCHRTIDNGANWVEYSAGLNTLPPYATILEFFLEGNDLFAATDKGIIKSTSFGAWAALGTGLPPNYQAVSIKRFDGALFLSGGYIDQATSTPYGTLHKSTDNGATWTDVSSPFGFQAYSIGGRLVVSGANLLFDARSNLYSTTDGTNWNLIPNGMTGVSDFLVDADGMLYASREVGTEGGVYASGDFGATWFNITGNLFNSNVTTIDVMNGELYAGTQWGGVWKRTLDFTVGVPQNFVAKTQLNIFPNPAADKINVSVPARSGDMAYRISNVLGKEVGKGTVNSSATTINTANLSAGVYVLNLAGNTAKFVIAR